VRERITVQAAGLLLIASSTLLVMAACSSTSAAPATGGQTSSGATRVNIDEIFPPDEGRDIILQNCVNCHTIAPIALARMTSGEWSRHRLDHRQRVSGISDAEADLVWAYLAKHLGPDRPIPQLPKELLDTWTSY
jgi:mono/diheme cytochrome c family protein